MIINFLDVQGEMLLRNKRVISLIHNEYPAIGCECKGKGKLQVYNKFPGNNLGVKVCIAFICRDGGTWTRIN